MNRYSAYQIGGKYSEAMEDTRVFGKELKNKPKEEVLRLLEGIKKSKDFKKYHPTKKIYYLNKLREIYRQLENDKKYWKMQREIEKSFGDSLDTFRSVN